MWDYKTAKIDLIRKDLLNTKSLFLGINTDEMSLVFTDTLLSIFSRYISNNIITCNDKDAPWITSVVKSAIRRNSRVYRKWVTRGRKPNDHNKVREVQNSTNKTICEAKRSYFEKLGDKLSDPQTGQKHFWTAFKRSTNKKKLTNIPPILETNTYVMNFQQKAKIFNDYFAEQCKIHDNGSVLPDFISRTDISISYLDVNTDQIVNIIQKYSAKKANGCDEISVDMLQLCATELALPLCLIFQKCLSTARFLTYGNVQTSNPFSKKTTGKSNQITGLFHFYVFVAKY